MAGTNIWNAWVPRGVALLLVFMSNFFVAIMTIVYLFAVANFILFDCLANVLFVGSAWRISLLLAATSHFFVIGCPGKLLCIWAFLNILFLSLLPPSSLLLAVMRIIWLFFLLEFISSHTSTHTHARARAPTQTDAQMTVTCNIMIFFFISLTWLKLLHIVKPK